FRTAMGTRLVGAAALFLVPLILNRLGFVVISRLLLCTFISLFVFGISILDLKDGEPMSAASFVGLRLFLLVSLCFPFLLFDLRQRWLLIIGLSFPLLSIVFFDRIFHLFGVGYTPSGDQDLFYEFSNVRALISTFAIGSSLYFMKLVVENTERLNQHLLDRLEDQNVLIKRQAEAEVSKLNERLKVNLQQLSEREFILRQSQRVAKIGSWEYQISNAFTFWSEEMYNILGLDPDVDLKSRKVFQSIFGTNGKVVVYPAIRLLRTGKPFDITIPVQIDESNHKWIRIYAFPLLRDDRIIGVRGICHDITFYREAENLLRASEYKYRSLFEQAAEFIAVFDFEGKFHDVNASWCDSLGYSRDEMMRMKLEDLIDPAQLMAEPIRYTNLEKGERIFSYRRMMRKDGTLIDVESNARKLHDGKVLVIARDVTRLREAQKQIGESEARFRGAFEHSAIGMALVSIDGEWLKVNKELCHIVGYSNDELLSRTVRDIAFADDADQDNDLQQRLLSGELESFQRERRYIHRNGSVVWVNLNVSLVKDNQGAPLYFVAQIEDITSERQAREKLILNEANMEATINNTELLIWSVDRDFNLVMFNNQFAAHMKRNYGFQLQIGSRILTPANASSHTELSDKWIALYRKALEGNRITLEEKRFGLDFQYSLSPIVEADAVIGVSIFAEDITGRKARDRELAEANKKIGELRLMALSSAMSPHFIFNVLNSIQYFIAKNDRLNAINYLSTFSKLVRSILRHSVNNKIGLVDEIEMLRNYVHLEMVRFENKFDFSIEIDPDVKAEEESVVIPSLLIQPYVENAILHGLYNKQGQGKLTIRVREREGILFFEIEDNGIGREAARKLRERNFPAHKSMGIHITEERLKLINQSQHSAFEIEDLVYDGIPGGTRVRIGIPLEAG
ncbi:MAG: PAS domain S-box protein, partial [Bacteroidota bacterium]|nr:PAS domain S-box protein [Bacteroidota bacterium]